jgi:filamentous hemagglutinin
MSARGGVWTLGAFQRARAIEQALGANLPSNFPVIDRFARGIATSIKSLDIGAASYRNVATLTRTLNGYVDDLAVFAGRTWGEVTVPGASIAGRDWS